MILSLCGSIHSILRRQTLDWRTTVEATLSPIRAVPTLAVLSVVPPSQAPARIMVECYLWQRSSSIVCTNLNVYGVYASLSQSVTKTSSRLVRDKNLKPQLLEDAMIKQITWEDQWIGYDDADTVALKKNWASGLCFGGTMIWSVDFDDGNGRLVSSFFDLEINLVSKISNQSYLKIPL